MRESRSKYRRWLACSLFWAALACAGQARAQEDVVFKKGTFIEAGKQLTITLGFRELFTQGMRNRLKSGFATTVVMRLYLYEKGGGQPVIALARTLKAVYDLWDEEYLLRLDEPERSRQIRLRDQNRLVDVLTSFWRFPVIPLYRLENNHEYFVAVIAEVNPMSEALVEEVRKWLRNPYGEHRRASGDNFFGSFVSIFINDKIRSAEKTLRLRTQPFYRRP